MPADAPKPDAKYYSAAGFIGTVIVVGLLLVNLIDTNDSFRDFIYDSGDTSSFSLTSLLPSGELEVGKKVITNKVTTIRQDIAGSVLGEQAKRSVGVLAAGPVEAFDSLWWRVNYTNPPSGWVEQKDITAHVFLVRLFNIFAIIYEMFLNIWLVITIICLIALIFIKMKKVKLAAFVEKKKKIESGEVPEYEAKPEAGISGLPTGPGPVPAAPKASSKTQDKWKHVQELMKSHNTNDWKQAIIEADIILEEMLEKMQYAGDSIGEKLKNVEESDFITLNKAWEAHKVRNNIAHRGSEYKMTKQEADRVINLYQKVFEEFYYI